MKISIHTMAVESFVPMLESLSEILEKGAEHSKKNHVNLIDARLARDMYTLAQQVQQACHHARDGIARLTGRSLGAIEDVRTTFDGLKAQIARTLADIRGATAAEFDGADERDCSIEIEDHMVIAMDGLRFLRAWSLPHFYFHLVTAYGILRNHGIAIGKKDYLSQVGGFIHGSRTPA